MRGELAVGPLDLGRHGFSGGGIAHVDAPFGPEVLRMARIERRERFEVCAIPIKDVVEQPQLQFAPQRVLELDLVAALPGVDRGDRRLVGLLLPLRPPVGLRAGQFRRIEIDAFHTALVSDPDTSSSSARALCSSGLRASGTLAPIWSLIIVSTSA